MLLFCVGVEREVWLYDVVGVKRERYDYDVDGVEREVWSGCGIWFYDKHTHNTL